MVSKNHQVTVAEPKNCKVTAEIRRLTNRRKKKRILQITKVYLVLCKHSYTLVLKVFDNQRVIRL